MKTLIPIAIACFAGAALAAPPAEPEPVAASFQRMLDHAPTPTARIDVNDLQRRFGTDPLQAGVNAALWKAEPDWYHVDSRLASGRHITR